jgi:hypothetical protein
MAIETYYVDDDVLFKGTFKDVDGVELTPTSVTAEVIEDDETVTVAETAGTVSGNQVRYQYNNLVAGRYVLYFRALIGTDDRTVEIPFRVITRDGHTA